MAVRIASVSWLPLLLLVVAATAAVATAVASAAPLSGEAIAAHRARLQEQFPFPQLQPRPHDAVAAVQALIARRFPQLVGAFVLQTVQATADGRDVLELDKDSAGSGKPVLRGSSGVALASALNWYLNEYAHVQLSWSGDQITIPSPLPVPAQKMRKEKPVRFTYNYNVCTVSYSTAFWGLERWQRELDWMALNGVNLVLAFTGQEYVWREMYRTHFNISAEQLNDFFAGPGFFAWQRMGNIRGWGGPLDDGFITGQYHLQLQLLAAMRSMGIVPVLPAFAGFVPYALKQQYPQADVVYADNWGTFPEQYCCAMLLQPTDPMHKQIGEAFLKVQTELYGTDHVYNCDMFNEMSPASSLPEYITNTSRTVYNELRAVDSQAVWLLQGWFLYDDQAFWKPAQTEAFFAGVANDGMIVLDLYADKSPVWAMTQSFYGKPFIWCTLHNFGGTQGLDASLWEIINRVPATLADPNATMIGVGLTMEGINQNYAVYELTLDLAFATPGHPWDLFAWLSKFISKRYGPSVPAVAQQAWAAIARTVYNNTNLDLSVTRSLIEFPPGFVMVRPGFMPTQLYYDPLVLEPIWGQLLQAADVLGSLSTYRYDLIDVGRQVLSNRFLALHEQLVANYKAGNMSAMDTCADAMLTIISDLDRLFATHEDCLLGPWIADARAIAEWNETYYQVPAQKAAALQALEFNARNQVTMWGPNAEVGDYAGKGWSGLYLTYYRPRWVIFTQMLHDSLAAGTAFDQGALNQKTLAFDRQWQHDTQTFPVYALGNTVNVSRALYNTYIQPMQPVPTPDTSSSSAEFWSDSRAVVMVVFVAVLALAVLLLLACCMRTRSAGAATSAGGSAANSKPLIAAAI